MPEQNTIVGGKVRVYKRPKQHLSAVLKLFRARIDAPHQRREPQSPGNRRELGTYSFVENPRWRDQRRKSFREVSEQYLANTTSSRRDQTATSNT